jgi:hypothetical protein
MALQYSTTLRNNQLDQAEATTGASAKLQLRSGAAPANCGAADAGTLLCEITLPSDWMNAASAGSKTKLGTWTGTGAAGAGSGTNAGHFRIKDNAGTTCHIQGTVTITGGGGDMTVTNPSIAVGQTVTVDTFTLNAGNA